MRINSNSFQTLNSGNKPKNNISNLKQQTFSTLSKGGSDVSSHVNITLFTGEETCASKWIQSGLSFCLKYDEESTKENPCMLATGIDEEGKSFEKKIYINDVDPKDATYVEMTALEVHLNDGKSDTTIKSLTYNNSDAKLNDKINFIDSYQNYTMQSAQAKWPGHEVFSQYMAEFERNMFEQLHKEI